jgi:predicted phage tail protein
VCTPLGGQQFKTRRENQYNVLILATGVFTETWEVERQMQEAMRSPHRTWPVAKQFTSPEPVVFFTIHDAPELIARLHPFAHGFVSKSAAGTELIPMLSRLAAEYPAGTGGSGHGSGSSGLAICAHREKETVCVPIPT